MSSIFNKINANDKNKLLKELEAEKLFFKKNTSLLKKISLNNLIGILEKGSAQIIRTDYNGNKIIIEDLQEESIFGIKFSLLNNDEYDIVTKEDSEFIFIDYDYIIKHNQKKSKYYQRFLTNLLEIMTDMVYHKNERINILTRKTTREKLLEYFQKEAKKSFSKQIRLPFNLTELAEYLSIDRSAMMREIKRLKDDKIIESNGNKIRFLN